MLDVHPPHQPTHTWKDFFIHIATIVVGLLIAVGLEQTVEYFHHREQRTQLLEDLQQEAKERIRAIDHNNLVHEAQEKWYRDIMHAALSARPAGGFVTFVVPERSMPPNPSDQKPPSAVWDAAKASGLVGVLRRDEIEVWNRDNLYSELTQRRVEAWNADTRARRGIEDHLGIVLRPGETIRITLDGRDELTRALGIDIEDIRDVIQADSTTEGSSKAILHGARSTDALTPYIQRQLDSLPR